MPYIFTIVLLLTIFGLAKAASTNCKWDQVLYAEGSGAAKQLRSPSTTDGHTTKTHCSWILKAYFHEDRVQLEIVEVNFSHDTLFAESFLDLRNGSSMYDPLIRRFNATDSNITVISYENILYVEFYRHNNTDSEFIASYKNIPKGYPSYGFIFAIIGGSFLASMLVFIVLKTHNPMPSGLLKYVYRNHYTQAPSVTNSLRIDR